MKTAVVIGSGMSGLCAGLLLAMHDYKVTLVEQHSRPGGLLQRFYRKAWAFDTGFHYCGGVAHEDILGRILRHLGVHDRLTFLPLDEDGFDRLRFPGLEFRVPVGVDRYRARLKDTFPHEATGIDAFVDALEGAVETYGLCQFNAHIDRERLFEVERMSLRAVLDAHLRDPTAKAVLAGQGFLYGVPPSEAPFGLHAVILHHFLCGATRIRGGGEALANALSQRLGELGGTLRLRSKVRQVLVDDLEATGVVLASGEEIRADLVISSMHPRTLLDCIPKTAVRKVYRNRVREQRPGLACMGIYVGLDGPPQGLANCNVFRHRSYDLDDAIRGISETEVPLYFATAAAEGRPSRGAAPSNAVMVNVLLDYERVEAWRGSRSGRRPPEYMALKRRLEGVVLEALFEDFPALRSQVMRVESSTGLTNEFYTGVPRGAMYGHYHCVGQMGRYRPSQIIRIRHFVQVGQAVFTPGILGAALSAYYGTGWVLGLETLLQELKDC
ncbi:MAG: NAD(P)/FAD-dependent oxidoreductase [Deltaproteobacteria bacterium]|nr:NAD(P)/FAD-dependent oxidoreductase [Deltaproteobacteria bacterium]